MSDYSSDCSILSSPRAPNRANDEAEAVEFLQYEKLVNAEATTLQLTLSMARSKGVPLTTIFFILGEVKKFVGELMENGKGTSNLSDEQIKRIDNMVPIVKLNSDKSK